MQRNSGNVPVVVKTAGAFCVLSNGVVSYTQYSSARLYLAITVKKNKQHVNRYSELQDRRVSKITRVGLL